jgi:uncharacterized protein (TIGR00297 family)
MIALLITGLILGAVVAGLAWRARALSRSGAVAAVLSGGLIFGLGGLSWAVLLLTFFISSSLLSRAFSRRKTGLSEKFSKGSQRDWGQVLANGGLGAMLAVLHVLFPGQVWPWLAFVGAMAAVNADTWATELGVLSRSAPRSIISGMTVERGASGGVTLIGYLAAAGGALLIGWVAGVFSPDAHLPVLLFSAILGGLAGASFDSVLGATLQAIYCCPTCKTETERHPLHTCGTETTLLRGLPWLNNDLVNFACSMVGAAVGVLVWAVAI